MTGANWPDGDAEARWLAAFLARHGIPAEISVWDDPAVDWASAPLTIIRSAWDYHRKHAAFLAWADRVSDLTRLENPPDVIRWNTHKSYLSRLEAAGIAVIPTVMVEDPDPGRVERVLVERGWSRAMLKPIVGLDGEDVEEVSPTRLPGAGLEGTWLLQPFVPEILTDGEVSVVVIEGAITVAVRKRAAVGEVRVQPRYGGTIEIATVEEEAAAVTAACLDVIGKPLLYARVDVVRYGGRYHVMELELVEPTLYLDEDARSAEAMLAGIRGRLKV